MNISKKIIELREQKGWSQYRLYKEAKIGQSTLSQIESGSRYPNTATLQKIATALDVSMAEFDENKNEAAQLLPHVMNELQSMDMNEEEKTAYELIKKMSASDIEKDILDILPIAKRLKSLSAKDREAVNTIINSLSLLDK